MRTHAPNVVMLRMTNPSPSVVNLMSVSDAIEDDRARPHLSSSRQLTFGQQNVPCLANHALRGRSSLSVMSRMEASENPVATGRDPAI